MGLETATRVKHCQTEVKGTEKWQDKRDIILARKSYKNVFF